MEYPIDVERDYVGLTLSTTDDHNMQSTQKFEYEVCINATYYVNEKSPYFPNK